MNRREFLSLGAGMVASAALGDLKVFETGIPNEQVLKIKQLEIKLGLDRAFKAFHFSDTHLNFFDAVDFSSVGRPKQEHFHRRWVRFPQAVQSFYASLDYARTHHLPLLHTGDLVDFVTDGNVRFLAHNLAALDLHYAIGNHEYQTRAPEHYDPEPTKVRARMQSFFRNDLTVAERLTGGVNFVAFDNARQNLRDEVIAGVKAAFRKPFPVVLMCHIPPIYTEKFRDNSRLSHQRIARGLGARAEDIAKMPRPGNVWDSYNPKTRAFYEWLRKQSQLKAILCGHTHIAEADAFSETAQMYVAGGNYEGRAYEITFT